MFLKLLCILLVTVSYGLILSSFVLPRLNSLSFREGKYKKAFNSTIHDLNAFYINNIHCLYSL